MKRPSKTSAITVIKTTVATTGMLTAIWFASPAFAQVGGNLIDSAGQLIESSGIGQRSRVQQFNCITTDH
ncbi:MAG: hypothetical protein V7707_12305 [Motiliproteus sp.]